MKYFKTNKTFAVYNDRSQKIGDYIIEMKVEQLNFTENDVNIKGYYFYKNESNEIFITSRFDLIYDWTTIEAIETNLEILSTQNIKQALLKRITDFTFLRLSLEENQNFGTIVTDWEEV